MPSQQTSAKTVGILFPGDMGSSLGRVLGEEGIRIVTTLEGRSARTRRLCEESGMTALSTMVEVVRASDIVLSVVIPAAAMEVARRYVALVDQAPLGALYVDGNSIPPQRAIEIARLFAGGPADFVDGGIHGGSAQLRTLGTLVLSGERAPEVAALFSRSLRTKCLGDEPGQASAFKMMLGGMAKGLSALFLEMSLLGRQMNVLDELLETYQQFYPGVMTAVERMLPTYPQHAVRRGDEMMDLAQTMLWAGLHPCMVKGSHRLLAAVGGLELGKETPGGGKWTVREVIEAVHAKNMLQTMSD